MRLIDILTSPWAIVPDKLAEIQEIYATHLRGEKIDIDAIEARLGRPLANEQQEYRMEQGGVAVLPIAGVIANKANMFTRISGGMSAQMGAQQVASMRADSRVRGVVLDFDTPGGSVFGIPAFASEIRALAAEKPVVAVSTGQMASAGYWLASAANAVYLSGETDLVGSIGVVMTHNYQPNKAGAETTEITAGRYKRIASDTAPLTKEGRAYLQGMVDDLYTAFVEAVAQHRQVSAADVIEHMADGRTFVGRRGVEAGLADGIASLDALVEEMASNPQKFSSRRRAVFAFGGIPRASAGDAVALDAEPVLLEATAATQDEEPTMTHEELAAQFAAEHPEAAALLRTEGATAECARIQAVEAMSLPGHEALIAQMKFDGQTTGEQAAVKVMQAEKESLAARARDLAAAAPEILPASASATGETVAPVAAFKAPAGFGVDPARATLLAKARDYAAEHQCSLEAAIKAINQE